MTNRIAQMIRAFGKSWKAATIATKIPPIVKPIRGMRSKNPTMTPIVTARSTPMISRESHVKTPAAIASIRLTETLGLDHPRDPGGDPPQALRRGVVESLEEPLALLAPVEEQEERQREDGDRGDEVLQDAHGDVPYVAGGVAQLRRDRGRQAL